MATAAIANLEDEFTPTDKPAGPCVMVVFGAAGDLTRRKLVPALYNLAKEKLLPQNFAVLGVSVDELNTEQVCEQVTQFLQDEDRATEAWEGFGGRLNYLQGEFGDPNTYTRLAARLDELDREHATEGNYLFYLATAPKFFAQIVCQLGEAGLVIEENGRWRRVV